MWSTNTQIRQLIEPRRDKAFFLLDIDDLRYKIQLWKSCFPRVKPFYAVKCNNHPVVVKFLADQNLGFDCASMGEMQQVTALGAAHDRIVYAHTIKPISHLEYSKSINVRRMTFDNEAELYKIKKYHPEAELILRIKVMEEAALYRLGNKFGCFPEHAVHLLDTAKQLNLTVIGTSFHVGCANLDPQCAFEKALRDARVICDAGIRLGYSMKLIDIGGGWTGYSGSGNQFKQLATGVNTVLDELFPASENYEIISEPGTFFVQSAFTIFTPIVGKKVLTQTENNGQAIFVK